MRLEVLSVNVRGYVEPGLSRICLSGVVVSPGSSTGRVRPAEKTENSWTNLNSGHKEVELRINYGCDTDFLLANIFICILFIAFSSLEKIL